MAIWRTIQKAFQPLRKSSVVLHIGRNKCGSTTIQDFCLRNRGKLHDEGVDYALFGHLHDSQPDCPGYQTFEELAAHVRSKPDYKHLISNEFMFGWPDEFTQAAAGVLREFNTQVIAYIRPYDDWIISAYAEETRRGMNMRDIDAYAEWIGPRTSAWRFLSKWAEYFGWDHLRVRSLGEGALRGDDLLRDFLAALDLSISVSDLSFRNTSPHWIELELARYLTVRNGDADWCGVDQAVLEPLVTAVRPLAASQPPTPYLSPDGRQRLIRLYNKDLQRLAVVTAPTLAAAPPPPATPRPFIPAFDQIPEEVLRPFVQHVTSAEFARAEPKAAERACDLGQGRGRA